MKVFLITAITYSILYLISGYILGKLFKKSIIKMSAPTVFLAIAIWSMIYSYNRTSIDRVYLKNNLASVVEVVNGNTFNVMIYSPVNRYIVLDRVTVPDDPFLAAKAKDVLRVLIDKKQVKIVPTGQMNKESNYWLADVYLDSLNINNYLIKNELYRSQESETGAANVLINQNEELIEHRGSVGFEEKPSSIEKNVKADTIEERASAQSTDSIIVKDKVEPTPWWRWVLYFFLWPTMFGMLCNKRPPGFVGFPLILFFVVKDFINALKYDFAIWPFVVLILWLLVIGGKAIEANKLAIELDPELKNGYRR